MNSDFGGWSPPSPHNPQPEQPTQPRQHSPFAPEFGGTPPVVHEQFSASVPLGGQVPVEYVEEPERDTLGFLMAALLMVSSVVLAIATTFEWRDYGNRAVGVLETGWTQPNGSLGRGWIVVIVAILWAISGVCMVTTKKTLGRRIAIWSAAAAALYAIAEWGFGVGELRTGPGTGLWLVLALSALIMMILGGFDPDQPRRSRR